MRGVINQVLKQQLDGQHRQKWQENAGNKYGKRVPKVRCDRHFNVLHGISINATTLNNTVFQHQQTLFKQNNATDILGNIRRGIDADTDIGFTQSGGVIDAVTRTTPSGGKEQTFVGQLFQNLIRGQGT